MQPFQLREWWYLVQFNQ